ncbi:hypothetical protein, partial [Pseudomonas prosekii]|uniref:hypothetical protein n=1 Tax=Pseudomonas prosekii TaxID=1148509 RepID=UPI001C7E0922
LLALGCEAAPNSVSHYRFCGCYAPKREQARSPQILYVLRNAQLSSGRFTTENQGIGRQNTG